jgi:hypothetical protein
MTQPTLQLALILAVYLSAADPTGRMAGIAAFHPACDPAAAAEGQRPLIAAF